MLPNCWLSTMSSEGQQAGAIAPLTSSATVIYTGSLHVQPAVSTKLAVRGIFGSYFRRQEEIMIDE